MSAFLRVLRRRINALCGDDSGTILPLIAGYVAVALALVVVTVDMTSLYVAQRQTDALADAAALAGADGFIFVVEGGTPIARLSTADVRAQAEALLAVSPHTAKLTDVSVDDAVTARVTIETVWHPPFISPLVPGGVRLSSTGTGRTALG